MLRPSPARVLVVLIILSSAGTSFPQTQSAASTKSPLCTAENALEMIKQQVAVSRTLNDATSRITVLVRAADLLWTFDQTRARAAFAEAFEMASHVENESEQKVPRALILRLQVVDQRYVVIQAVARRDLKWARQLTDEMLRPDNDTKPSSASDSFENVLIAERLLRSAIDLMAIDINASLALANVSLRYPASSALNRFLLSLAEINQETADQFYLKALSVYRDKPMSEFLYLQAYPFGWPDTTNTPLFSFYRVPKTLKPNKALQRQFVLLMIRRAEQLLDDAADIGERFQRSDGEWLPGKAHLLSGLIRLEPDVRVFLPDLLPAITQAREKILVSLAPENQKLLMEPGREVSERTDMSFEDSVKSADRESDTNDRNEAIANVLMRDTSHETLEKLLETIDKISDTSLRTHLLDYIFFLRTVASLKDRQLELAERLSLKVAGHEQRAYLQVEIANALLKKSNSQVHAREVLDGAIAEAKRAGATIFAARVLFTASDLYSNIDLNQSVSLLDDAVRVVNQLDSPDFKADNQSLQKRIPRNPVKNRGHFLFHYYMPGLDPENAFREMAKRDFDTSLAQLQTLTDKFQRTLATLAVAETCLVSTPLPRKNR